MCWLLFMQLSKRLSDEVKILDGWTRAPSDAISQISEPLQGAASLVKGTLCEVARAKVRALGSNRVRVWPHREPPPFCSLVDSASGRPLEFGVATTCYAGVCYMFRIERSEEPLALEIMEEIYESIRGSSRTRAGK